MEAQVGMAGQSGDWMKMEGTPVKSDTSLLLVDQRLAKWAPAIRRQLGSQGGKDSRISFLALVAQRKARATLNANAEVQGRGQGVSLSNLAPV